MMYHLIILDENDNNHDDAKYIYNPYNKKMFKYYKIAGRYIEYPMTYRELYDEFKDTISPIILKSIEDNVFSKGYDLCTVDKNTLYDIIMSIGNDTIATNKC